MRTRIVLSIGLAGLMILAVCTALAGHASSATDYTLTTADGLALSLSNTGEVTSLQIDGNESVSAAAPALWLRDLSDADTVVEPNLVNNPGFETGLAGWTRLIDTGLDVSVIPSPTHSEGGALQFTNPITDTYAFAAYASDPVSVTPGQRYRVSAWWRSATGYVASTAGPPTHLQLALWRDLPYTNGLYVQWFDPAGQPLGDPELAVALHQNAANWRLTRRELTAPAGAGSVRLIIGAKLSGETLWVDDAAFVRSPEEELSVDGIIAPCPGFLNSQGLGGIGATAEACLVQSATLGSGLTLTVTYTAHADHIAVHGEVRDLEGRDRALDVSWGVPANLTGWTWWDDVHTSRSITDTGIYAHDVSAIYDGWLPVSLYPYAGISNEGADSGLAVGVPLDRPQLALLAHAGAEGRYGATFHLGISPQATKVGPQASFDLMLYRFNPSWGFRDVIARHAAIQPEVYTTSAPVYDFVDAEQGWFFTENGVQKALLHDEQNIYSAQYTVGELPLKVAPSSGPRPSLDQALAAVTDALGSPKPWDVAFGRAITESAVVDPNGDWSLKHIGVYPWAPDRWEVSWAANLDPDLDEGLASWLLDWRITPAFTATTEAGAHLDGVQIDNFMSTPALDLRPEPLAAADWPLAYTPHTYQPAVHNGFAFREYLAFLRDYLDAEWGAERGISVNFWGLGHPNYLAEYIDAFSSEGQLKGNGEGPNWNPEILDYRRAIAYSRPYLFANQTDGLTAVEAFTFTQTALLYGVRPRRGPNAPEWTPEVMQIISDTADLVNGYWDAGWQPLTYAQADGDEVWIERFRQGGRGAEVQGSGGAEEQGSTGEGLYFAVHNRTDLTRTATITIEATPLGITYPTSVEITDLAAGQPVPFSVEEGNIVVSPDLGPRQTRVLQVSGGTIPPASRCVGDANDNGIGDVADIQATGSELPCQVYLPVVAAQWRRPWPTPNERSPYPRLGRLTWYLPSSFARGLSDRTDGRVTLDDPNQTALPDFLAAHQAVIVSGRPLAGDYAGVEADRNRLARAKEEAGFVLLGRWETNGIELDNLFTRIGPNSPWPFVPEWFVQELAAPLPGAVHAEDTVLPIASGEQSAYCRPRMNYVNDQVIILDGERSEALKLDCDAWDGSSLEIPLTRDSELRSSYDFGQFKHDHAAGTSVRINVNPSWDDWWGYNMTDIGPTYEGLRWNEHRPRVIYNQFKQVRDSQGRLIFDGVELDTFNQEFFGPYNSSRQVVERLDLDADGQRDLTQPDPPHEPANCFPDYYTKQPNWANCAWAAGTTTFVRNLRALWDADAELTSGHDVVMQLAFGENAQYVNGQLFENLPSLELATDPEGNRWETAYEHYAYWQSHGRAPSVNVIQAGYGIYSGSGGRDDLALMRLSLAFTLMGNGYFVYDGGACCHGSTLWWYDEYAVDYQGRAIDVYDPAPVHPLVNIDTDLLEEGQFAATVGPGLGYLGYPITNAYTVTAGVYRRDFDRGIVVANFGFGAVTLSLERRYRKISGIQDCDTNDGSLVTELTLPAKDAIILLDPAYFDGGADLHGRLDRFCTGDVEALQGE